MEKYLSTQFPFMEIEGILKSCFSKTSLVSLRSSDRISVSSIVLIEYSQLTNETLSEDLRGIRKDGVRCVCLHPI